VSQPVERPICDGHTVERLITAMAGDLDRTRRSDVPLRLVGVRTRGVPLAERLADELARRSGVQVPVGAVDITLYRDDLGRTQTWPVLRGTEIPFDIEGADIVLVDDVLFTGRTVRAALNAICDLGRPASVRLAVLVDRGHRELPIRADVVGLEQPTQRTDHVQVRLRPADPRDEIVAIEGVLGRGTPTSPPPPSEGRPPS
jgi:pyrimidine operon attenuation protein / uracil phosphoribosyltransferase